MVGSVREKRPGSVNSLSRSLRLLTEEKNSSTQWLDEQIAGDSIKHDLFLELNFNEKKRVLAYYMRKMNMKNYSQNHILEVIKRLDSQKKNTNLFYLSTIGQLMHSKLRLVLFE